MIDGSRTVKLSRADEQWAEKVYRRKWRQIRRWLEKGEASGEPCPLFDPLKLLNWWPRHSTWRVPVEIEEAAVAATKGELPQRGSSDSPAPATTGATVPSSNETKSRTSSSKSPPQEPGKSINLEDFDPEEGDRLRELKQLQAAKFRELTEKLKAGTASGIDESKYLALCETVDKIETRVTERLKKRGLYILREVVERDIASNAELIRQSGVAMVRKVLERCPSLDATQRAEVAAAITHVRAGEERILSRIPAFESTDDLLRELNAA